MLTGICGRNWLTAVVNRKSDETILSSFDYTYDNVGNRLTMTKNSIITDYTYNANNQLTTEHSTLATINYSYDLNGNLISKTDGSDTTLYAWDYDNRLLIVNSPLPTINYSYDGDGNRIAKVVDGLKTKYINDLALPLVQVLLETNGAGVVQKTYNYGNDLISSINYQPYTINYFHYDGLGSVRQMTDSSEAVTAEYTYDAFGNLIAQTETSENVYKFTGEQFDSSSGLLYLRHRYYSPDIGRFVNRDPVLKQMPFYDNFIWYLPYLIEAPENLNAYVYVTNNPIKYVDPNGLAWWDPTTWNTTNYCGWTKSRSDKEPRSKIDACCKQHDECLAQDNVGSCLQGWKKGVRDCHKDLVKCVSKIK